MFVPSDHHLNIALQSIYEDGAISVWKPNHVESQHLRDMIRLEVRTA